MYIYIYISVNKTLVQMLAEGPWGQILIKQRKPTPFSSVVNEERHILYSLLIADRVLMRFLQESDHKQGLKPAICNWSTTNIFYLVGTWHP